MTEKRPFSGRKMEVLVLGSSFKESLSFLVMRIELTCISSPPADSWSINGLATFIESEDGSNIFCHVSKSWIALFKHSLIGTYLLFL
jgi:hypothetical protein